MEARSFPLSAAGEHNNPFRLTGKVAVITGAGSGIGRAIALRFAQAGASVRILDINQSAGEAVAKEIADMGGAKAEVRACDVSKLGEVKATFQEICRREPVNILVNNAGVSHIGTVESTSEADFDRLFQINVKGVYNCTHAVIA